MNFFRRLFDGNYTRIDDPVFGKLVRENGALSGTCLWPQDPTPFAILIHRNKGAPTESDRVCYASLSGNYSARKPRFQSALEELWNRASAFAKDKVGRF